MQTAASNTQKNHYLAECERLKDLLYRNQLVQAHEANQQMEAMIQDRLLNESPLVIEEHVLWPALCCCLRIKCKILSGRFQAAYYEATVLGDMLNK